VTDVAEIHRSEWGRLLSALIRRFGDFDLAEEALAEAFAAAVTEWRIAPPKNAQGWLYGTARHKAIDRLRRQKVLDTKLAMLALDEVDSAVDPGELGVIPDERLRLIFTCCHPALAEEAQVALTLRTLLGLTTEEIARAFLVPTITMAQRLVRAKAKIREAGIPYAVPESRDLPERIEAVMTVLYLLFNEGYAATRGDVLAKTAADTDWQEIAGLYQRLLQLHPSPIVALNHAAAVAMADGPVVALPMVEALEKDLANYHLWHATRADLLRRLGRNDEAVASYKRAHALAQNEAEKGFFAKRIHELS
jgi:RNA polymerase sigma-70 factor (ECF subfamily)